MPFKMMSILSYCQASCVIREEYRWPMRGDRPIEFMSLVDFA